jgi:hypothetical protein
MIIKRPGHVPGNEDVYIFRFDVNASSTIVHVYLDEYHRSHKGKILSSSPRWRRNDPSFSTLDSVSVPKNVTNEMLELLKSSITLHYPDQEDA